MRNREQLEEQVLEELRVAGRRYQSKECSREDYQNALKRFTDFTLGGKLPEDLEPKGRAESA